MRALRASSAVDSSGAGQVGSPTGWDGASLPGYGAACFKTF